MVSDNIWVNLMDALDSIIMFVIDLVFFPIDAVIGFIWGGIKFLVTEVIFG